MTSKEPSRKDLLATCSEIGPEDGIDPHLSFRPSRPRVKNRKALQLCAQIAETLSSVLAGECGDALLRELCVTSVVPAPDSSHLLVTLALVPDGPPLAEVQAHLERASGKLRSEVASSIHRKQVPLLTFHIAS
jgi:ribosome-binding factor A